MTFIRLKLDEHIKRSGMTQKEFAEACELRPATISQMVNNKYDRIQLEHLLKLMKHLNISDFNQMLEIVEDEKSS